MLKVGEFFDNENVQVYFRPVFLPPATPPTRLIDAIQDDETGARLVTEMPN